MISRRNIRVKVMQTLYVLDTREAPVPPAEAVKLLQKQFDLSTELFVFLVHILAEVARYAETDSRNRASKHLPTSEDLNVNTRIAGNELLWTIIELPSYKSAFNQFKPNLKIDNELVKKLYNELAETEQYKSYIELNSREKKSEKDILDFIFNDIILPSEIFESHIEELFNNWDDDVDMMHQMMQHFLQKPASMNFQDMLGNDKWEFAKGLLETVLEKKEVAMDMIKPKLKNWDPDRIALLDMILMQMGVCEFLFFETIPPKVTINEYIDLAKDYSTPQSGQFVNGILDNIHKDLVKENKLHKIAYKKVD
ncbi:MAG TPA: transcription antitermination factor NusB [Chitinophagaceae bacterium]|nr:transcription antitermination factor NusB [Chitinophagaceae bacterium]